MRTKRAVEKTADIDCAPTKREAGSQVGSRTELMSRWQAVYGCPPPPGTRTDLLILSDGWHHQAKRLGDMSKDTKRRLAREVARVTEESQARLRPPSPSVINSETAGTGSVGGADQSLEAVDPQVNAVAAASLREVSERRSLSPGARLLRDWNGRAHAVDVVVGGYFYEGTTYRSLSAVARTITGAHWSGPRFFGL